jgi:hypothetical protein
MSNLKTMLRCDSNHRSPSSKGRANKNNCMGNDPSNPSDDNLSSDSTYKPDRTKPTDSEATTSSLTDEERSCYGS